MFNKKGAFPVIEVVVIMIFTSAILIFFLIQLYALKGYQIDQGKLRQQIFLENLMNKCVLDVKNKYNNYGLFDQTIINEENFKKCIPEELKTISKMTFFKYENEKESKTIKTIYVNSDKKKFIKEKKFCKFSKTKKCNSLNMPIRILENGKFKTGKIQIELISQRY